MVDSQDNGFASSIVKGLCKYAYITPNGDIPMTILDNGDGLFYMGKIYCNARGKKKEKQVCGVHIKNDYNMRHSLVNKCEDRKKAISLSPFPLADLSLGEQD